MDKRILGRVALAGLVGMLLLSGTVYFLPATTLHSYFWLERKLDLQVLRDWEPKLIQSHVLRPARVRIRGGFRMMLDPRDLVPLSLLRSDEWQPDVWESLLPGLPKGGVFLDVGAHIGYFTLKAARQVGPEGKAIGFEPNPETAALLRGNIAANAISNVIVQQVACADREQQLTFYAAPTINTGASSISEANAEYGDAERPRPFQVRARPIDDVVRELNLTRVDAIKIDTEGAELLVLRGAMETLKRFHPKIVLEMDPEHLAGFHTTMDEVSQLIRSAGYTNGVPLGPNATDWEWTIAKSEVKMSDPATAGQLLRGFSGVNANAWRWTAGKFAVALRPPDDAAVRGAILVGKFVYPDVAFRQLKQMRLSARIGDTELPAQTFDKDGEHEYRVEVPTRLLQNNPTEIQFSADKTIRDANQELALIVTSIALESPK